MRKFYTAFKCIPTARIIIYDGILSFRPGRGATTERRRFSAAVGSENRVARGLAGGVQYDYFDYRY